MFKNAKIKFFVGATLSLVVFMLFTLQTQNELGGSEIFTPGPMTHGHHQIELSCNSCHNPDGGFRESSCVDCHGAELEKIEDSHPEKKFRDPRNADRLAVINASKCVTCHTEHQAERTGEMGLTVPQDFCVHCHDDIAKERPSHEGMGFNTCATAGCHNFHDNKALYDKFVEKHLDDAPIKADPKNPIRKKYPVDEMGQKVPEPNYPDTLKFDPRVIKEWQISQHAQANVNCTDCHNQKEQGQQGKVQWKTEIGTMSCANCHGEIESQFLDSKHGMKIKAGLGEMQPRFAKLDMKSSASHKKMNCVTCHGTHQFETQKVAVQSCVQCHNDQHTQTYFESAHYTLWLKEQAGEAAPGTGVSCATCHLPRVKNVDGEIMPHHNPNDFMRPNEKMIRSSCLNCHGLEFTYQAIADSVLIRGNFHKAPTVGAPTIEMVRQRLHSVSTSIPKGDQP